MANFYPYLIIGSGIIGCSLARELCLRGLGPVAVLDKESEIGLHASSRNSGVLHSGINQRPDSLKSKLCIRGTRLAVEFCVQHGVRFEQCGTIVVSRNSYEYSVLEKLLDMGRQAGVQGLRLIDSDELHQREPSVTGQKALFSPSGAIVDSEGFVRAVAEGSCWCNCVGE